MSPTGKQPSCTQGKAQDAQQTQNNLLLGRLLSGGSSQASLMGGINPMRSTFSRTFHPPTLTVVSVPVASCSREFHGWI